MKIPKGGDPANTLFTDLGNSSQRQVRLAARAESSKQRLTYPEELVNLSRIQPLELVKSEHRSFVTGTGLASTIWAEGNVIKLRVMLTWFCVGSVDFPLTLTPYASS